MNGSGIDVVRGQEEILEALEHSRSYGNSIGISAPILGEGIFITKVVDISASEPFLITLKAYDITGYILKKNTLTLSEIIGVCPFKSEFKNPYLKNLENDGLRSL